jgi:hypothetical protein
MNAPLLTSSSLLRRWRHLSHRKGAKGAKKNSTMNYANYTNKGIAESIIDEARDGRDLVGAVGVPPARFEDFLTTKAQRH